MPLAAKWSLRPEPPAPPAPAGPRTFVATRSAYNPDTRTIDVTIDGEISTLDTIYFIAPGGVPEDVTDAEVHFTAAGHRDIVRLREGRVARGLHWREKAGLALAVIHTPVAWVPLASFD